MINPYQDQIQPTCDGQITSIDTSKEYPYEDGKFIKRDAEHPYPLNYRLESPGIERVFLFNLHHLTQLDSIEIVKIINPDVTQISYLLEYSYTIDMVSWFPYQSSFVQFKDTVNEAITSGLNVSIRVKVRTYRMEEETDYTDPVTWNPRDKSAIRELIIDRFKINGVDQWSETIDGKEIIHFYVPDYIEIPNSVDLIRDLTSNLYNIYGNMDKAQKINLDTAKGISLFTGFWVYYFRTMPDQDSRSATFRQYRMKNVVDVKMIKMSIPGNKIPTNRNTYTEWGINFADEFQAHFLNEFFDNAFGPGARPHTDDYVFFPLTNRMYNINTGTDIKKFMYKSTYTEVILVKYEQRQTVNDDMFAENLLDFIEIQQLGGPEIIERQERQAAQPDYVDLRRYEAVRTYMHNSVQITKNNLKINGTQIFLNMYLMSALYAETVAIKYKPLNRNFINNFSVSMWFVFENVNENRTLWSYQNIKLSLQNGSLRLSQGNRSVLYEVDAGKLYHVACSHSNDMAFMSLLVHQWNEAELSIDFKYFNFEQATNLPEVTEFWLYGGKQLIGFIRMDNYVVDEDNAISHIIDVFPKPETNIFTDKCTPAVIQSRTHT